MNIAEIVPKENYILYIKTDDGQTGLFDVTPYLESEAFKPLKDRSEFERIHNGRYYIEWECGADLSVDTIEARWKPGAIENAQQDRPSGVHTL
ncbi:MAG: DUF2442 domain-containing protein [Candidatus Methylomirabilota bacterium]|nr:DUF2442 domain-containing protein [Candidatus Methylomirabilis sp.]NJD69476.1 DUF2442 domain-containing protein [candidate division NC10 bacterium]PWB47328.1 MAG: DUF2442 domain-containing protein [candidate division NC10 bacterium]